MQSGLSLFLWWDCKYTLPIFLNIAKHHTTQQHNLKCGYSTVLFLYVISEHWHWLNLRGHVLFKMSILRCSRKLKWHTIYNARAQGLLLKFANRLPWKTFTRPETPSLNFWYNSIFAIFKENIERAIRNFHRALSLHIVMKRPLW